MSYLRTPEYRKRRAELIRKWKPWEKSTGPKTEDGKATSAGNSLKHGMRSREWLEQVREINLKTAFNTENTEKNTENTEGWLETPTHPAGELKRYLCALCVSVFSVLKELVTEFSRIKPPETPQSEF
jgi:hypothetical protein